MSLFLKTERRMLFIITIEQTFDKCSKLNVLCLVIVMILKADNQ